MLRWYLSPSPNFYSDWVWPYCVEAFNVEPGKKSKINKCRACLCLFRTVEYLVLIYLIATVSWFGYPWVIPYGYPALPVNLRADLAWAG